MNRLKNARNGILVGIINNFLNIILPFVTRTIIIYKLGNEYLGLGGLFTSILNVLSLTELGVGAAISYTLYKPIAENDISKINAILNLYRTIYRIIGIVILGLSLLILPFLDILVAGDYPANMNVYILFLIYVLNTILSYFMFAYKKIIFSAHQRYDLEVGIVTITSLFQYLIQIFILVKYTNYYLYIAVMPFMTVLNNILCNWVIKNKYPQYKCGGKIEKQEIHGIFKNVGGAFLIKIGTTVYMSVDNIVISAFLGLGILGIYSNYYYIISILIAIFSVVHNAIRPILGNYIVTESLESNWSCFKSVNFLYMWGVTFCCSCCMILFQPFEYLWVGKANMLPFTIVVLLVIYLYSGRLFAILNVYQEAAGILWQGKFIPLISAILNLILNIIMVKVIGLPGVLLSSIISSLLINLPGSIYIMFTHFFKNKQYMREFIGFICVFSIKSFFVVALTWEICYQIKGNTIIVMIVKMISCVLITNVLLILTNCKNKDMKNAVLLLKKNK